jgi:uncharacterized protein YukE
MLNGGNGVGVEQSTMETACQGLRTDATAIQGYIDDIDRMVQTLPSIWSGNDLDTLVAEFAAFKQKLMELPVVVTSIASWGESTTACYVEQANKGEQAFSQIFH